VKTWLTDHPRFHFHFTPTGALWLNLVDRFFAEFTRKRLRPGKDPRPSIWPASGSAILREIKRVKRR